MALFKGDLKERVILLIEESVGLLYAICSAVCLACEDMILYKGGAIFHPAFIFACNSVVVFCLCLMSAVAFNMTKWRPESSSQLIYVFLYGTFCSASQLTISLAVFSIGPGNSVALTFTLTIFSVILSVIFLKSKLRVTDAFFAVCSSGGVALIAVTVDQGEMHQAVYTIPVTFGVISALLGALTTAGVLTVGSYLASAYDNSTMIINLLSYSCQYCLCSLALCALFNAWTKPDDLEEILTLLATGLTTFGGIGFSYLAVSRESPTTVSVIATSQVLINYVGQFVFFDFAFHWEILAGSLLIVGSCIGVILSGKELEGKENEDGGETDDLNEREEQSILGKRKQLYND